MRGGRLKQKARWAIFAIGLTIALCVLLARSYGEPSGYALRRAAFVADAKKVRKILERDPGCVNDISNRDAPTTRPRSSGMAEVIYQLKQVIRHATKGGQFDAWENARYSALDMAVRGGDPEVVRVLLAAGANPHYINRQNFTALHQAIQLRKPELVRLFLDAKVSLETPDAHGITPLGWAAFAGNTALVMQLIEAGADPNGGRMPPLHWAADNGQLASARVLIVGGAEVNRKDFWKRTPLAIARERSRVQMVEFLESQGAVAEAEIKLPPPTTPEGP